jgi:hypothetical protein
MAKETIRVLGDRGPGLVHFPFGEGGIGHFDGLSQRRYEPSRFVYLK